MQKKQIILNGNVKAVLCLDNIEVIHITGKMRFRPQTDKSSWKSETADIKSIFEKTVHELVSVSPYFEDRYLYNINVSDGNLSTKKWSRLNFEIYVKPIHESAEGELVHVAEKASDAVINRMKNIGMLIKED